MRAVSYERYGQPDVLHLTELPVPLIGAEDVLVRVKAAALNAWDWDLLRGRPLVNRIGAMRRPRYWVLGADVAGIVEAVGDGVTRFEAGDEVFGDLSASGWGGYAEYVRAPAAALTIKPSFLSFEQAAATPQAATMAYQGLQLGGGFEPGANLLVNGAGGGVGTFALQMAKARGATVTAVDKAVKLARLLDLGADRVLDYQTEDYTRLGEKFDFILDNTSVRPLADVERALAPGGKHVIIGGPMIRILQSVFLWSWRARRAGKQMLLLMARANHSLEEVVELMRTGAVKPEIDEVFTLEEVPDAFRYFLAGTFCGKIVVKVS